MVFGELPPLYLYSCPAAGEEPERPFIRCSVTGEPAVRHRCPGLGCTREMWITPRVLQRWQNGSLGLDCCCAFCYDSALKVRGRKAQEHELLESAGAAPNAAPPA